MKKKELKNAFEKEFEKITVSNKLKQKTLNSIKNHSTKKTSHIPYLRNFAAIFVVTLLCVSIYFARTKQNSKDITFDTEKSQISTESDKEGNSIETKNSQPLLKSSAPNREETKYSGTPANSSIESASSTTNMQTMDSTQTNNISELKNDSILADTEETQSKSEFDMTEEEFLKQYPNAKKTEDGYVVYEDTKETLYVFRNNALEIVLTIHE